MTNTSPKQLAIHWIDLLNRKDVSGITNLYHDDAIIHQVADAPVAGKENIRNMFAQDFVASISDTVIVVGSFFEVGEWAILGWQDQQHRLRGCYFFEGLPEVMF